MKSSLRAPGLSRVLRGVASVLACWCLSVSPAAFSAAAQPAGGLIPNPATTAHNLERADLESWLDGFIPYAIDTGNIAGGVITVVKDGEVVFAKGYGYSDVEKHTPV